jgi:hypothetical protein
MEVSNASVATAAPQLSTNDAIIAKIKLREQAQNADLKLQNRLYQSGANPVKGWHDKDEAIKCFAASYVGDIYDGSAIGGKFDKLGLVDGQEFVATIFSTQFEGEIKSMTVKAKSATGEILPITILKKPIMWYCIGTGKKATSTLVLRFIAAKTTENGQIIAAHVALSGADLDEAKALKAKFNDAVDEIKVDSVNNETVTEQNPALALARK